MARRRRASALAPDSQDGVTSILGVVILIATFLCLLASNGYPAPRAVSAPAEYTAILLWCAAGTLLMLRATELLTVFVALELFSICLYTLAGYHRRNVMSTESAIKYFLMGAFVSAFVLLRHRHPLWRDRHHQASTRSPSTLHFSGGLTPAAASLGLLMLVAGFGFKLSPRSLPRLGSRRLPGRSLSPSWPSLSVAPKVASAVVLDPGPRDRALRGGRMVDWRLAHGTAGGGVDDLRHSGGAGPAGHQAHAGVLRHRPHGLPDDSHSASWDPGSCLDARSSSICWRTP